LKLEIISEKFEFDIRKTDRVFIKKASLNLVEIRIILITGRNRKKKKMLENLQKFKD